MRLSQNTEWAIIVGLVLYIAFTPGFQAVRDVLSTGIGKAVGLAIIVWAWKSLSPLIALLLVVNFVRCASMRERMESGAGAMPSSTTHCPEGYTLDPDGQCKNESGGSVPASVCMAGQQWDGNKCAAPAPATAPAAAAPPPPAAMPPPPSMSSTTTKQPFSNMTPSPIVGGVQPDMKETYENFAPA
jgi:hypothetical protein